MVGLDKTSKRVLFISIDFYEYNLRICKAMEELGYSVDFFCQDPGINGIEKLYKKFDEKYELIKSFKMQNALINGLAGQKAEYSYILVIKGDKLQAEFLKKLKELNKNARMILYLWDDIGRVPNFFENRVFFDRIFTFDRFDKEKYNIEFLPLFFCDEFRYNNTEKTIDVYFSGWEHSDRRELLEKLIGVFQKNNLKYYYYVYTGFWSLQMQKIKKLDFKKEPEYIKYKTLSMIKNAELTLSSRVLIDIQHPTQKGLTMRTIESLAANAKLITTNSDIVNYDFYSPENITVIDRDNPLVDVDFIKSPYKKIDKEIIEKYSLKSWIKTILSD